MENKNTSRNPFPWIGKVCKYERDIGVLVGIEITEEDFYYVLKVDDDELYFSCVGGIELA